MYIRPNPKLRIFYVVMVAPLGAAAGVIYLVYQTLQPQYHFLLGRNLFLGVLLTGAGVVSWHLSLDLARTLKQFVEACQAVSRGELTLQTDTSGMAEIRQLAAAFNQMHESLDTSFSHWVLASRENHRIFLGLVRAISGEMDSKDFYMRGHVGRVACYATWIAEEMGVPPAQVERIRFSALLHDIGKIGLSDQILAKTGMLTEEEFEIMKSHPLRGAQMLRPIAELADVVPGVELHHESLDGRGYPYGLKGEEIPLMARIIAVADAFDAMTMHRPYQAAMDADHVLRVLRKLSVTKFDPWAVEAICRVYAAGRIQLPSTEDAGDEEPRDSLASA
jgi:putative nucleotidyltransferase with HDIG domain